MKWGGELTPSGRVQAEELGRVFRCMYPGGQGMEVIFRTLSMIPGTVYVCCFRTLKKDFVCFLLYVALPVSQHKKSVQDKCLTHPF